MIKSKKYLKQKNRKKQKPNIKNNFKFLFISLIFVVVSLFLGILHFYFLPNHILDINKTNGSKQIYQYFSFAKYNLFLIFFIIISFLINKKKFFSNSLFFSILVNFLINTFLFNSFLIRDYNIYNSEIRYLNLIIYYLEYIIIPFAYVCFFYFFIKIKLSYKVLFHSWGLFLFYFLIQFLLKNPLNLQIESFFREQYIIPSIRSHSYLNFLKIILVFLFLSTSLFFLYKTKMKSILRIFLFFIIIFITSCSFYNKNDWLHAKKVLQSRTMGNGLFPESQQLSEYFTKVSSLDETTLKDNEYKILELGSGSGNVTKYLVDKFGEENIITIELEKELCDKLREDYPKMTVITGNASDFINLIKPHTNDDTTKIKGIVSTLPLTIFDNTTFNQINKNITYTVQKNKINYLQYRFKIFETSTRKIKGLKEKENSFFISEMIMPVSIYIYE
ncbi:hypothetical protein ['Camptotheca acuminata' phytoplasma]|uniref:hypothetical protein n=1 Tax='Camptotheca acuminata' phytoplasma TaxID=3239192 RepID=UPI00351A7CBB